MRLVKTKENACLYTNRTVIYVSATRDSPENNAKNITVSSKNSLITSIEFYMKSTTSKPILGEPNDNRYRN